MPVAQLLSQTPRRLSQLLCISLLSYGLSACSLWQNQSLQQSQSWHAKGKIGINSPQHKGSAWLDWQQQQNQFKLQLSGPLGFGAMQISGDESRIDLRYKGRLYADLKPQQLEQLTGVDLPLAHLPFWAQGQISPYSPSTATQYQQQDLSQLEQAGWQLQFSRYKAVGLQRLPSKIKLLKQNTKLTIIFKSWIYQ